MEGGNLPGPLDQVSGRAAIRWHLADQCQMIGLEG
jgi:hypothetical protein